MIPNEEEEGQHYLEVKKLSALLRGVTSKHDGMNKRKIKSHEKVCKKKKDLCGVVFHQKRIIYQNSINT